MSFDARVLRDQFPLLADAGVELRYLDNAATSQVHGLALEALIRHETTSRANVRRGSHRLAEAATLAYEKARQQAARFLNASGGEIVFTSGATAALNLVAFGHGARLAPGDEIVVSAAEHHSNLLPWRSLAGRCGARLRVLSLTADGRIDAQALERAVTERCRLIAVTHASNVTGAVTDVAAIVAAARGVGARVLLDGAQRAQHGPIDVAALGADYYVFSGHKCFAPGGIGVLWGRPEALADLPPFMIGGGMASAFDGDEAAWVPPPERFEAGTPPIAAAVGLGAALEWSLALPWSEIRLHEETLAKRLLEGLADMPDVRLVGPRDMRERLPIVSFTVEGLHAHDVCQVLDGVGVALRGGHHCARPLLDALGIDAAVRASIALFNTTDDIDALLEGLAQARKVLR